MPTVIDSLIVKLGLDGTAFSKGAVDVGKAQKGIGASTVALGKDMESATRVMLAGVTKLRNEFLGLFALFAAGAGIRQFNSQLLDADAATSRTAKNIGIATEELYAFQKAGERSGGSAAGVASSLQSISSAWAQFRIDGTGADGMIAALSRLGVGLYGTNGALKSQTQLFTEMNAAVQNRPRPEANEILRQYGLDEGMRNLILSDRKEFQKQLDDAGRLGAPSKSWTEFAIQVQQFFSRMTQRLETFWRGMIEPVMPLLRAVMSLIERTLDRLGESWAGSIGKSIEATLESTRKWLDSINSGDIDRFLDSFKELVQVAKDFGNRFMAVLKAIHAWTPPAWLRSALNLPESPAALPGSAANPDGKGEVMFTIPGLGWKIRRAPDASRAATNDPAAGPAAGATEGGGIMSRIGRIFGFGTNASFDAKSGDVKARLMADLNLTNEQASSILGNLGHESGLQAINERNPVGGGRGGFGWAQWTGPRRIAFEEWSKQRGLDVNSDEANYGFLKHELQGSERGALDALRQTRTIEDGTRVFQEKFERAGVVALGSRIAFANRAAGNNALSGNAAPSAPNGSVVGDWLRDQRLRLSAVQEGAAGAAANGGALASIRAGNSSTVNSADNSISNQTSINGPINIHTRATDARGIASGIGGYLGDLGAYQARRGVA